VAVLVRDQRTVLADGRAALHRIRAEAGRRFVPEMVEALAEEAAVERFWFDAVYGSPEVIAQAIPAAVHLDLADLRALARLLWAFVDFRSRFTATHTSGVVEVARILGARSGLDEAAAAEVGIAASLHDIGKLAIPGEILESEHPLDDRSRDQIRAHPYLGWRVLGRIRGLERLNALASYHHERLDGTGYPFRLGAADLPLGSRIVAVADVFTALTEERPYRRGLSSRETIGLLRGMAEAGALDPAVVNVAERSREELSAGRRQVQQSAAERYLHFSETLAGPIPTYHVSAA
jgi:HD-GYP domain-containing protein (c-di-GMP phosphodiesterase class II)